MMTDEQLKLARLAAPHVRKNPPEGIVLVRDVPRPGSWERWRYVWAADEGGGRGTWMSFEGIIHEPSSGYTPEDFDGILDVGIPDLTDPLTAMWVERDEGLAAAMAKAVLS